MSTFRCDLQISIKKETITKSKRLKHILIFVAHVFVYLCGNFFLKLICTLIQLPSSGPLQKNWHTILNMVICFFQATSMQITLVFQHKLNKISPLSFTIRPRMWIQVNWFNFDWNCSVLNCVLCFWPLIYWSKTQFNTLQFVLINTLHIIDGWLSLNCEL